MKNVVVFSLLCLFLSISAFGEENHGQELTGVVASRDSATPNVDFFNEQGAYLWRLNLNQYAQTLTKDGRIASLSWRAYDSSTNTYYQWQKLNPPPPTCPAGCVVPIEVAVSGKGNVKLFVPMMKYMIIEFAINSTQPTHYFSVEKICTENPGKIFNETTSEKGCP